MGVSAVRTTRFFFPRGVESLAGGHESAPATCSAMQASITRARTVAFSVFDVPNLVPLFNAYAWAASLAKEHSTSFALPCEQPGYRKHFSAAGLVVRSTEAGYTVLSTNKGGVFHYVARDGGATEINCGLLAANPRGHYYSTQKVGAGEQVKVEDDAIELEAAFYPLRGGPPSVFQFTVLRGLCLTLMRWQPTRE